MSLPGYKAAWVAVGAAVLFVPLLFFCVWGRSTCATHCPSCLERLVERDSDEELEAFQMINPIFSSFVERWNKQYENTDPGVTPHGHLLPQFRGRIKVTVYEKQKPRFRFKHDYLRGYECFFETTTGCYYHIHNAQVFAQDGAYRYDQKLCPPVRGGPGQQGSPPQYNRHEAQQEGVYDSHNQQTYIYGGAPQQAGVMVPQPVYHGQSSPPGYTRQPPMSGEGGHWKMRSDG